MKKNAAIFKNNRLLRFQKGEKVLENNSVLLRMAEGNVSSRLYCFAASSALAS